MVGPARAPAGGEDRSFMPVQELRRVPLIRHAMEQKMTQVKAGARLELTTRPEVRRLIERVEQEGDKRLSDYSFIMGPSRLRHLSPVEGHPGWPSFGRRARPFRGCASETLIAFSPPFPLSRRVTPISDPAALSGVPTPGGVRVRLGRIGDRTRRLHFLSFIARSTSRPASRVLMDSRRSCCFLPLANPSSTLARPRVEK